MAEGCSVETLIGNPLTTEVHEPVQALSGSRSMGGEGRGEMP